MRDTQMAELPRVPVQSRASHQLQDSPCSWSVQLFLAISEEREVAQCSLPVLPAGEAMSATAHSHYCLLHVPALLTERATSISLCSFLNGDRFYILCSLLFLVGLQFEHCIMILSKVWFSQGISLLFLLNALERQDTGTVSF